MTGFDSEYKVYLRMESVESGGRVSEAVEKFLGVAVESLDAISVWLLRLRDIRPQWCLSSHLIKNGPRTKYHSSQHNYNT